MQNNFIYTIVLIIIGLFVISTIYHNYLETSSIEGFSTNTTRNRPSEAEMAEIEEREVMEIPNTMAELYHDPYEMDATVPEIKMDQGSHAVPDKEEFDKVLHLDNAEEEGFKNEENVGIFTKFYNFLIGKKPVKEGFGFGGILMGLLTSQPIILVLMVVDIPSLFKDQTLHTRNPHCHIIIEEEDVIDVTEEGEEMLDVGSGIIPLKCITTEMQ